MPGSAYAGRVSREAEREELAAFLRTRRRRRSPVDAGLVAGRRRTPGLRREDVATLAGVSVTWYTWLEQGRDIRPSEQVLSSLARALDLDTAETAHLFRLAGQLPPVCEPAPADEIQPVYRLLLDQLDPCPAMITNHRFDVLAWNRSHTAMFGDFGDYDADERNMLWYTFTASQARKLVINWADDAAHMVALFRSQASELLSSAPFTRLINKLRRASVEFDTLWERRDLAGFSPGRQQLEHPELGRIELQPVKLYAVDQDRTLVAYLTDPAGSVHRRLAAGLGARASTPFKPSQGSVPRMMASL